MKCQYLLYLEDPPACHSSVEGDFQSGGSRQARLWRVRISKCQKHLADTYRMLPIKPRRCFGCDEEL
jgi:hypothetical protein